MGVFLFFRQDRDWVICATHLPGRQPMYVAGSTTETLEVWTDNTAKGHHVVRIPYTGDSHLPKPKRNANWITSVTGDGNAIYVGDIHGQISMTTKRNLLRKRGEISPDTKPKRVRMEFPYNVYAVHSTKNKPRFYHINAYF